MSLLSSVTVLSLVDSMAIVLSQAYQLARVSLASAGGRQPNTIREIPVYLEGGNGYNETHLALRVCADVHGVDQASDK